MNLDNLIEYFAQLPKTKNVNLSELKTNLFETCTRNFLNGQQRLVMIEAIARLKAQFKYIEVTGIGSKNEELYCFLNRSEEKVIEFINSRPRKQWIIQQRRYLEEVSNQTQTATK